MRRLSFILIALPMLVILNGCASSKVSSVRQVSITHSVNTIAMAPSGGVLADAVALELFNRRYNVIDTNQLSQYMVRLNLNEIEVMQPQNLTLLKDEGIDVLLNCRAVAGYDGLPQSASVRLTSTHTGEIVAGLTWQNGRGGQVGSVADRTMRKDVTEAAIEIVTELVKNFPEQ